MKIVVNRRYKKEGYTIGDMLIDGVWVCNTLEDKDYGFDQKNTPISLIRKTKEQHPKAVAIPRGTYKVSVEFYRNFSVTHPWYNTTSCKGKIPCLVDVPGYTGILIHCGSNAGHTSGCILVGYNTIKGGLTNSKNAFVKVCDAIMEASKKGEIIEIEIK